MGTSALLPLDVNRFLLELRRIGCTLGEPFHYFSTTTSTNDELKQLADAAAPHGTTGFADFQTSGRGRQGKTWSAQPYAQVLTSVLLRQPGMANNATITLAVGVALHRVLQALLPDEPSLRIKWPNDIEAQGRKLAGILTESHVGADGAVATVVGFGVNVWEPPATSEDNMQAIALRSLGCDVDREVLLVQLLKSVSEALLVFQRSGLTSFVEYLNRYDALLGTTVSIDGIFGRATGINPDGALVLDTVDGLRTLSSGTVERTPR